MFSKWWRARLSLVVLGAVSIAALAAASVGAHPLGNFTINHFARIEVAKDHVVVRYIVDMAEISTLQELQAAGVGNPNSPTPEELAGYLTRVAIEYPVGIALSIDGSQVVLKCVSKSISMPDGAGGLKTLRTELTFQGDLPYTPISSAHAVQFIDNNQRERIGWHELVVAGDTGISIYNSSAYGSAVTDELRAYPQDALVSPLNERQCDFSFTTGMTPVGARTLQSRSGAKIVGNRDRLAELIAVPRITPAVALLGLLIAAILGSLHAMSPGHGKTIVGAYLVGSRGTARHAAFLGLTVTVTHTAGVFALGLVTLLASRYVVPERLYPFLSFLSGFMVVAIGLRLLVRRTRVILSTRKREEDYSHSHSQSHADHSHAHSHDAHAHHSQAHHSHAHHSHHSHSHDEEHHHPHQAGLRHSHSPDHEHFHETSAEERCHDHRHTNDQARLHSHGDLKHSHGGFSHSHLPPGADGTPLGWRSLLALGISGGLLPCPSALVVLLAAISLHRVGYGLVLVLSFSAGLAAMLTSVGLVFVFAGRFLKRWAQVRSQGKAGRFAFVNKVVRIVPAGSALVVTLAGAAICWEALRQAGLNGSYLIIQLGTTGRMVGFGLIGALATICLRLAYRPKRA